MNKELSPLEAVQAKSISRKQAVEVAYAVISSGAIGFATDIAEQRKTDFEELEPSIWEARCMQAILLAIRDGELRKELLHGLETALLGLTATINLNSQM